MHKSWLGPALAILVAALLSIFLARTSLSLKENSLNSNSPSAWASVDVPLKRPEAAVDRFAGVLKFRTISSKTKENHVVYPEDFRGLHKYFRKQWPLVFKQLQVNTVIALHDEFDMLPFLYLQEIHEDTILHLLSLRQKMYIVLLIFPFITLQAVLALLQSSSLPWSLAYGSGLLI